jgi:hypothetical protein
MFNKAGDDADAGQRYAAFESWWDFTPYAGFDKQNVPRGLRISDCVCTQGRLITNRVFYVKSPRLSQTHCSHHSGPFSKHVFSNYWRYG